MRTVFLVDDDAGVRRSLKRVLAEEGFNVLTYDSAEMFLADRDPKLSGCLVLDVTMPGFDGLALQQHLVATRPALPIVFLTGHGDIAMSVRAMKGGAADFLTKPVSASTLAAAIREAFAHDDDNRRADDDSKELSRLYETLTPREREVLAAVAAGKLNKQIAAEFGVVEQTIKFHRARIMGRMRARTVAELMRMAAALEVGGRRVVRRNAPGRSGTAPEPR